MATVAKTRSIGYASTIRGCSPISPLLAAALSYAAKKPAADSRDSLKPGDYEIAEVVKIVGVLHVGHDTETAATATPDANTLVGLILAKLNSQTRAAVCRDLAAEFVAAGGQYPAVDDSIIAMAETLTANLRRKVSQKRRGSVTGQFSIGKAGSPALAVVG